MLLTIAIPTYNRPDKVRNTLLRLIPQLKENVCIRILDNCSNTVIKDYVANDIPEEVSDRVEIIRHRVNIGPDVNFQRCFELCYTPYIWQLGDDDVVEDNAVEIILNEIDKYKDLDLIGINFKSNCMDVERPVPIIINNIKELGEKLDHFGNWLFISTSVYKTDEYLRYISYQGWGAYSMASQLVPPMMAISKGKAFVLSEKYLVTNVPEDPTVKWSDVDLALALSTLLEARVGFKQNEYKAFGKKLSFLLSSVYPGEALYIIIKSVNNNLSLIDNYHIYIYRQLIIKAIEFKTRKYRQLLQYYVCLFLLKNKGFLKLTLQLLPRFRRKVNNAIPFHLFKR